MIVTATSDAGTFHHCGKRGDEGISLPMDLSFAMSSPPSFGFAVHPVHPERSEAKSRHERLRAG
jgi:hypothetical protein